MAPTTLPQSHASTRPRCAVALGLLPLGPAPFGLLALATALDVFFGGQSEALTSLAFWTLALGVALGTWYTMFALLDWIAFARLGKAGACGVDGFLHAVVVGLYGLSAVFRVATAAHAAPSSAMALEVAGAALMPLVPCIGRELAAWICERG